jgi:hypothetical protein
MGNTSSPGLSGRTQEAIEEWWGDRAAGDPCDELFTGSSAVDHLLASEPLAAAGLASSTEGGLAPGDVADLAARVQGMASALGAGVAPRDAAAVVAHLVAELSATCSVAAPGARRLQRRRLVLRGLRAHLASAQLAAAGRVGDGADGGDADLPGLPGSLSRAASTPGLDAAPHDAGGHNTEWPSEYIATQQVRGGAL